MSSDRAILYSSGVAEFDRGIELPSGGTKSIAIRVRRNELADLLASFEVLGNVRYASPPTWDGTGQAPTLSIDPHAALPNLLVQLAGARVEVECAHAGTVRGQLVGVHEETRGGEGQSWQESYVCVMTEGGLERYPLAEVRNVRPEDATLRAEIDRALRQKLESLRPSATTLRFELAALDGEVPNARMRYTIPSAAWKISYRLRIHDYKVALGAFAIVDNDGEEDWDDMRITVVTGEPISFTTDLADARRPMRKTVRLVADQAFRAVEVEEGMLADAAFEGAVAASPSKPMAKRSRGMRLAAAGGGGVDGEREEMAALEAAQIDDAASREVGEFQVFETAENVTIKKGESAAIPLFNLELGESRSVLHYKFGEHAERPWRAIDFVHDGGFALGRGVCTVTEEGVFAGTCIMPALKPGGDALLPHALETGVRVRLDEEGVRDEHKGYSFAGGFLVTQTERTRRVLYRVRNGRDETFSFLLDHELSMHDAQIACRALRESGEQEIAIESKLASGYRVRFDLMAGEELAVEVVESAPQSSHVSISTHGQFEWLFDVFLVSQPAIASREEFRELATKRGELEAIRRDLEGMRSEHERLHQRQERLRKNVEALQRHEHADKWRDELSSSEERLYALEETEMPGAEARERAKIEEIEELISALSLTIM